VNISPASQDLEDQIGNLADAGANATSGSA
jgi:hypothetical protein